MLSSNCETDYETTIQASYPSPMANTCHKSPEHAGARQKHVSNNLYKMASCETAAEQSPPPPLVDYTSATHADFYKPISGKYGGCKFHIIPNFLLFMQ